MAIHFSVLTLLPEFFSSLHHGLIGKSHEKGAWSYSLINPRDFVSNASAHRSVDDRPFGGGDGMVIQSEPIAKALEAASEGHPSTWVIHLTPQGHPLNQEMVVALSKKPHVVIICGRYSGIDQRVINTHVNQEISLGDFIMTGGEPGALCLIDSICRVLPFTLGNDESVQSDSFNLPSVFESPLFTRPEIWRNQKVPEALVSGNHERIEKFRFQVGLARTWLRRPELLEEDQKYLAQSFLSQLTTEERRVLGLERVSGGLGLP